MKGKFSTKSKLWVMTILVLIAIIIPMTVRAADSTLPNASNGVITLENDVELDEVFVVGEGEHLIIDLNGKKLTTDITVKGELTVTDSSNGEGLIENTKSIKVQGGTFTLESGNIKNDKEYGVYASEDGKVNINGGKIISYYAPLAGNNLTGAMTFKITGGTIEAKFGPAIYMPGPISLDITGGEIIGGISLRMGIVNISGGTINAIKSNIDSPAEYYDYGQNAWLPDALYVFNGVYTTNIEGHTNKLELNITGGTFNCENGQGSAVAIYDIARVEQKSAVKISGDAILKTNAEDRLAYQVLSLSDIGVENPKEGYGNAEYVGKVNTEITGGTYSNNVSKYVAEGYFAGKQADETYLVKQIVDIADVSITGILDKLYTGEKLEQDITIKYKGTELKEGTDYIISYEDNKEIGTAKVVITGKGYYKGEVIKTFKINPLSIKDIKVTGIANKTYNKKELTQNIIVTLNGKELKNGTDYTVSYKNNTKPGKATVEIIGKGIYEGTITKTFLITPNKLTGLKVSSQTTSTVKLSWSKHEGVTGYKVYSYNYSKKKWEYVGETSSTSYTIKKLKAATTYKYRVRAYKTIDGTEYFGSYATSVKTATQPKTPSVKVKAGDRKVTFTWNKVSGASGYRIYMATSKNGKYERIKTISNNKTFKYTKSGLKANKKYYFKVRAYKTVDDEKIFSSYTKVLTATTKKVHVVKKGNTLYNLAKKYKTTVTKLVKINNLKKANSIRIGLRLLLN